LTSATMTHVAHVDSRVANAQGSTKDNLETSLMIIVQLQINR
jgi:hypothetical protein